MWPHVVEYIAKACLSSRGRFLSADIKKLALERKVQLWVATQDDVLAVCVTEIICYPRKKYARVMILTGKEREKWMDIYKESIERWAAGIGCDGVESLARKGWKKVFPDYQDTHILLEKEF